MKAAPTLWATDAMTAVDSLGRSAFARHVVRTLMRVDATCGTVVGLEGEWGSGKTWVFNQIDVLAQELEAKDRPVILRFNPWLVSGTHDLVAAFLEQLARQLDEAAPKGKPGETARAVVGAIGKYAGALIAVKHLAPAINLVIPGLGLVVEGVAAAAGQVKDVADASQPALQKRATRGPSLVALRKDIETALRTYPHRIVVLIDDLDRIAPTEVAALVQAVKAVADFPGVVYLLAYAPATVARALEQGLQVNDGRAYLEKIVQLPLTLPEVPARRFQPFAVAQLRAALPPTGLDQQESEDLEKALPLAAALMRSPRDVARLRTQLAIASAAMCGEVNLADIVLAEALRLKVPEFLPWMRHHHAHVIAPGIARYDSSLNARGFHAGDVETIWSTDQENGDQREALKGQLRALAGAELLARAPYERVLEFVFDGLRRFPSANEARSGVRRLQRFRFWYRWQCLCDHQEPLTVQQVRAIVRDPSSSDARQWLATRDSFAEFCRQVCDLAEADITESDSSAWADVFIQAERQFGFEFVDNYDLGYGPFAALEEVLRIDGLPRRELAFRHIVANASPAMAGRLILAAIGERGSERRKARALSDRQLIADQATLDELATQWIQRVDTSLISNQWLHTPDHVCPYYYLAWMLEASRPATELQALAERLLKGEPARLVPFFADLLDKPETDPFPLHIEWGALPPAKSLHALAQNSEIFRASHRHLAELIARRAQESPT